APKRFSAQARRRGGLRASFRVFSGEGIPSSFMRISELFFLSDALSMKNPAKIILGGVSSADLVVI
ncbi:MAG: hypothetical protein QME74_02225, partial [Candidatus Edwardsbacteria bacterium]|nr:hypothetical protein [Candidatus Edwardsbacteria bacterium]